MSNGPKIGILTPIQSNPIPPPRRWDQIRSDQTIQKLTSQVAFVNQNMPMSGFNPPMLLSLSNSDGFAFGLILAAGVICSISSMTDFANTKLPSPTTTASKVLKKFWMKEGESWQSWEKCRVRVRIRVRVWCRVEEDKDRWGKGMEGKEGSGCKGRIMRWDEMGRESSNISLAI